MSAHRTLLPPGWPRPKGFSYGVEARGKLVVTGGLVGWDENERFPERDLPGQLRRLLTNLCAVLAEGGAEPRHIVRMTWYILDRDDYVRCLPEIGEAWRATLGKIFPPMAVVPVAALVERDALVEIETLAVVPDEEAGG